VLAILFESNAVINISVEYCTVCSEAGGKGGREEALYGKCLQENVDCPRSSLFPPFLLFWSYTVKSARVVVLLSSWKLSLVLPPPHSSLQLTNATIYYPVLPHGRYIPGRPLDSIVRRIRNMGGPPRWTSLARRQCFPLTLLLKSFFLK